MRVRDLLVRLENEVLRVVGVEVAGELKSKRHSGACALGR